jgi:hypothetical protein
VQDTDEKYARVAPLGGGVVIDVHDTPFHSWAPDMPTAIQPVIDQQETSDRLTLVARGRSVQETPFHDSATPLPTATHAVAEGHESAANASRNVPVGESVILAHVDPFHASARGWVP